MPDELKRMGAILNSMLSENPPLSLNKIGKRLGCHVQTFKAHFPDCFYLLEKRFTTYEVDRFDKGNIKPFLLAALDEFPPPSLESVVKRLNCSRGFVRDNFPKENRLIVERYAESRKIFVDPEDIRTQFQALQTEFPPLSIKQCAERLGCAYIHLYTYFPAVCRVVGARYANYYKGNARERREARRQAIIKTKLDLEAEGIFPTRYQIWKRLSHMGIKSLTNLEIDEALDGPKVIT